MIISITGCGSTLDLAHLPKDSLIIGVNRSYEEVKPHIICTSDANALAVIRKNRQEPIFYEVEFSKSHVVPTFFRFEAMKLGSHAVELPVMNSGAFAIWIASLMKPSKVYLSGFGGRGHFYPTEEANLGLRRENRNRDSVANALEYLDCEVVVDGA